MPSNLQPNVRTQQAGHRLVLNLDGQRIVLPINPEDLDWDMPTRSATVNTLAGAYQEAWGAGIGTLIINGSTGWMETHAGEGDGFEISQKLIGLHKSYQDKCAKGDPANVKFELTLPPFTSPTPTANSPTGLAPGAAGAILGAAAAVETVTVDGSTPGAGQYRVSSDDLRILRSKTSPLLFRYRWTFTILADEMHPAASPAGRFGLGGLAAGAASGVEAAGQAVSFIQGQQQSPPPAGTPQSQLPPLATTPFVTSGAESVPDIAHQLGLNTDQTLGLIALGRIDASRPLPAGLVLSVPQSTQLLAS